MLISMILTRITEDESRIAMAQIVAMRSTCRRRRVGCVLYSEQGLVLATGRNGTPRGTPHCIDTPCPGADYPSGQGLEFCDAVHAEINALIQCSNTEHIHTIVCTESPCIFCIRALLNTSCKEILFINEYPHPESKAKWEKAGRIWRHYNGPKSIL